MFLGDRPSWQFSSMTRRDVFFQQVQRRSTTRTLVAEGRTVVRSLTLRAAKAAAKPSAGGDLGDRGLGALALPPRAPASAVSRYTPSSIPSTLVPPKLPASTM